MSLRLRAVLITGIALAVLWSAAAAWMMRDVHANLDRTLDGRLAMSARMVSGLLERSAFSPGAAGPGWDDAVRVSGGEGIACEIRSLRGEVLARTEGGPHSAFEHLQAGYSIREVDGRAWRVYVLREGDYQIATADRMDERDNLVAELLRAAGVPFLIAFFGGLGALWIGIGRGLAPLKTLCRALCDKNTEDTAPIDNHGTPSELRPVLAAMNGLLGRLARALSHQRAFTDAAAHELRTPLTVIDTHLQVVRLTQGEQAQASLRSAEEGVTRLRRTLDQMMVLARAETPVGSDDSCVSVMAVADEIVARLDDAAHTRVTLVCEGADTCTPIPKSMLETVLRNLLDNALRYSPSSCPINIKISFGEAKKQCCIEVMDRGPGLSAEHTAQIGQRFWRGDQGRRRGDGAGLGISIVRAIAERFGGALSMVPRDQGGLIAKVTIPAGRW
ncbi:TPA: ATP-binding protein [Stenotrophomonas maltophilia]|jgi:two-component system sensor histidine kinase QseC|uniref:ATP-binding protein n=1 Tax=Burkholderia sp. LMG 13014 TaxID=2709306 RepID=UPI00196331FE|nr:ATP-binding protein [Burkholderia sp. LMG 13014]HDS1367952.1 sensor histidine kinase N-terminal domain-containing protein [Stenotrophomonas maltophilia]HEJ3239997.1 sensor histidine kinase N-terminal domain-containing protein [Pseudomonas aeruginosa]HDS1372566.1 sensor histidine kinase N-terminal domain-containing protein [Stenotrophomonas maltophilia]HDS1376491.1 sensor histidine kinase N-terminal domain-containing protein [Stenotrophomonas maltophilia]HDS1381345.1 sensor histidine kinase 